MSPWDDVRSALQSLTQVLEQPADAKRLYSFADGFVRLAKAYHVALKAEGKSSVRIQAVEKALDLKTGKSELTHFVSGPDASEQ
jgi:hypothetical protein